MLKIIKTKPNKNYKAMLVDDTYIVTGYYPDQNPEHYKKDRVYKNDEWVDVVRKAECIDIPIVELELEIESVSRGRSSVTFIFKDLNSDAEYVAGPSASLELFKISEKGKLSGLFTFKKQGESMHLHPYKGD